MEVARMVMGPAVDIEPMDALLLCVRIAAGEVAYTTWKISCLEEEEATWQSESVIEREAHGGEKAESYTETQRSNSAMLNIWITARSGATDRLARYSKMALDAGIAERQLQLAETAGDNLAIGIRGVLDGLGLTAEQEQKAPELVRTMLQRLEQTNAPADFEALLNAGT